MNDDKHRFDDEDRAAHAAYQPTEADIAEMSAYYAEAEMDAAYVSADMVDAMYVEHVRNPATGEALAMLTDLHGGDDCDGECPAPVEVLEVYETGHSYLRARVRCADGTVRVAVATARHYPGDRECPPDYDVDYHYEEVGS